MMTARLLGFATVAGVLALTASALWGFHRASVNSAVDAAVTAERNAVIERSIELTRQTDKALGVARKATDADLCRALGGEPGECSDD